MMGSPVLIARNSFLIVLAILSLLASTSVYSQEVTGDVQFNVVDSLGDPVPGVNAVVTGPNVQGVRGGVTNETGFCHVLVIPPGKIAVRLSHSAYIPIVVEGVLIQLGKTTNLGKITLLQRTVDMPELVVSGEHPRIDPSTTTYGSSLRPSDFENLPVDRDYKSMITLLPQSNKSYYGDGANIAGATGFENKYFVDGVEVTDPLRGASGTNLPYNFVQEVEVKAGGYDAEFRSALGGLLNVVTYSGTNDVHGSGFGFYTSNRFATDRRVGLSDPAQGGFSNYDVGFGVGGPVVRDQLWFFVAYNPTYARRDVDVPGYGISVDQTTVNSFATKLTWTASQHLHLVLTMTGDPTNQKAVTFGNGYPPATLANRDPYFIDLRHGGTNVSIAGTYIPAGNIVLGASLAKVTLYDTGNPSTERGREEILFNDHLTGFASGGVGVRWATNYFSTMSGVHGTLVAGAHTVSTGVEYTVKGVTNQSDYHGIVRYDSSGYYESFGWTAGKEVSHRMPAAFLQDKWQISRGLNVHGGIRWDGQYIVGSNGLVVQTVTYPLQPRLGFVYEPDEDGSQRIFGSFGRFSQELNLELSSVYHSNDGYDSTIFYPQDPRTSRNGGVTTLYQVHEIYPEVRGLRGQFFDEFSLGYERSITENIRMSLQGLFRTLREAIDDAFVADESRFRIGNPGEGILSAWPRPQRDYTALIVTIEQRGDEPFNFLASYVLSREYGNYEGLIDAMTRWLSPNQNGTFDDVNASRMNATGLVPNDRTHVFKFSGSYRFPFGLTTGISFIAESGTPLSEWGYSGIGKQFLTPRGSAGRTPAIWDLNMRCTYEVLLADLPRLRLILDVFHIASQRKPLDIDKFWGSVPPGGPFTITNPTYGRAFAYQPPMSARLGFEVSF